MNKDTRLSNDEDVKKLAEFKASLESKISKTESELQNLRLLLKYTDKALLERGFKRASISKQKLKSQEIPQAIGEKAKSLIRTAGGEPLAYLLVNNRSVRVIIEKDKEFNLKTPPFKQFLIDRVLSKMKEKDREEVAKGALDQGKVISYDLVQEGDLIKEIIIENVTNERLRELKSSIRWTLEKMHEKG